MQLDVTDEAAVKEMFDLLRREHGRLDALINNAGVASANHAVMTPFDVARRVFDTSVLGTFLFCREAAKVMTRQRRGVIVNLSSVHVPLASVGTSIYGAAKAAVEQFTRVFAKEVARSVLPSTV